MLLIYTQHVLCQWMSKSNGWNLLSCNVTLRLDDLSMDLIMCLCDKVFLSEENLKKTRDS